jgi:hypothetical protein
MSEAFSSLRFLAIALSRQIPSSHLQYCHSLNMTVIMITLPCDGGHIALLEKRISNETEPVQR